MTIRELADLHHLSKSGIRLYIDRLPAEHKTYELRRGQSVIVIDDKGAELIAGWIAANGAQYDRKQPYTVHTDDNPPHSTAQSPQSERGNDSTAPDSTSTAQQKTAKNTAVCTPHSTAQTIAQAQKISEKALETLIAELDRKDRTIAAQQATINALTAVIEKYATQPMPVPETPHRANMSLIQRIFGRREKA